MLTSFYIFTLPQPLPSVDEQFSSSGLQSLDEVSKDTKSNACGGDSVGTSFCDSMIQQASVLPVRVIDSVNVNG